MLNLLSVDSWPNVSAVTPIFSLRDHPEYNFDDIHNLTGSGKLQYQFPPFIIYGHYIIGNMADK